MEESSFGEDQKSKILEAVSLEMRIDLSKKHGKQLAKEIETILDDKQEDDEDLNEAFEKVREANRATLNKLESDGSQNLLVLRGEEYELVSDLSVWLWKDKILDILGADFISDKTKPQSMLIQTLSKKYGNLRREGYSEEEASNCIKKLALGRPIEQAEFEVRPGYFNWMRAHPYLTFATVLTLGLLSPITGLWAYIDVRNEKNEIKENDRDMEVTSIEKLALNLWGLEVSDSNKKRYQYLKKMGYEPTREMMVAYIKLGVRLPETNFLENSEEDKLEKPPVHDLVYSFFGFYLSGDPSMTVSKAKRLAEKKVNGSDPIEKLDKLMVAFPTALILVVCAILVGTLWAPVVTFAIATIVTVSSTLLFGAVMLVAWLSVGRSQAIINREIEGIEAGEELINKNQGWDKKEKVALKMLLTVREFREQHNEDNFSTSFKKFIDEEFSKSKGEALKGIKVKEDSYGPLYLISTRTGERIEAYTLLYRIYDRYLENKYGERYTQLAFEKRFHYLKLYHCSPDQVDKEFEGKKTSIYNSASLLTPPDNNEELKEERDNYIKVTGQENEMPGVEVNRNEQVTSKGDNNKKQDNGKPTWGGDPNSTG